MRNFIILISVALFGSLGFLSSGLVRGWSSTSIPWIQGSNNSTTSYALEQAPLSMEQISWIGSCAPIGAAIGGSLSFLFLQYFGRRKTMMIGSFAHSISFISLGLSSYSSSMIQILISRVVSGLGVGLTMASGQIYIVECVDTRIRGVLGSLPAVFMALGVFLVYIIGVNLPWHTMSYICAIFPVIQFLGVTNLPESPIWLIQNNLKNEGIRSLKWTRKGAKPEEIQNEIETLFNSKIQKEGSSQNLQLQTIFQSKEFLSQPVLLPLIISICLMFFQQWCGINVIIFNTGIIFEAAQSNINGNMSVILVGLVQFLATFGSIYFMDRCGRKPLLLISGGVMTVSLTLLGTFFYLKSIDSSTANLEWLPLFSLVIYMIGYSVGFAAIPFLLMAELFSTKYRSLFGGISSFFNLLNTFLSIKLFSNISAQVGFHGVFWIYGGISLSSVLFVWRFLPETKGKSLKEIESLFKM